jgi:hypothetical protein
MQMKAFATVMIAVVSAIGSASCRAPKYVVCCCDPTPAKLNGFRREVVTSSEASAEPPVLRVISPSQGNAPLADARVRTRALGDSIWQDVPATNNDSAMFAPSWTDGRTYEIRVDRLGYQPVADKLELSANVTRVTYGLSVYPLCLVDAELSGARAEAERGR